jgi:beta-glucanase (GH16 family)
MVKFVFSARAGLALLVSASAGIGPACHGQATNLLSNPGFEFDTSGAHQTFPGWHLYGGPNVYNESNSVIAHNGTNYLKVYQNFVSGVNDSGTYQDYISGPGATYSADGWAYTASTDALAGQNIAWIELTFRDANANILVLYRTALITTNLIADGGFPKGQWNDLRITNQYDPGTLQLTNTVTQLVAPPGTIFLRCQTVFEGDGNYSVGSVYFDDVKLTRTCSAPYGNMNIVWSDEFDGSAINTNIWTYDTGGGGWGNNELENYTSRTNNAFVTNGLLHIVGRQETLDSSSYTSARMKSEGLFSFTYGRLEWRAQLPYGVGLWPALWMLGTNINSIKWPSCGEIDVMENTGTNSFMAQSSIHYGGDGTAVYKFFDGGAVTNFHTYTLDWTTNALLFYVDGHLFETQSGAWGNGDGASPFPFNQPFFLVMNMAIGGNYVGNPPETNINAGTIFPAEVLVDYVRIYNTTEPFRIAVKQTGSSVVLSWPSNIVCRLEAETNPAPAGIGNNWISLDTTTNQMQITPIAGSAYFRLITP